MKKYADEAVTNKANEVLLKMLEGIDKGSDFVLEKAPEVVQQLLTWHMCESLAKSIFGLVILIVVCMVSLKIYKHSKVKVDTEDLIMVGGIVTIAALIITLITFEVLISLIWLKILIAPDLYLLEYASKLL